MAVAVVAGAMYVAAAPGSHQATGPTAAQFARLKKQVATLNKTVKALKKDEGQVKKEAVAVVDYLSACFFDSSGNIQNLPVNQFGTTSSGFLFGASTANAPRTALDIDGSGSPLAYLQEVTPACITNSTAAATSAHPSISRLERWAEHNR
ncbi:MAG TPA: hypothetical protein VE220_06775 [Gaiellaceae bacterium]|nr:hypothetical protein [Gaiellaceae bacterium]